jgi:hypothetical protein
MVKKADDIEFLTTGRQPSDSDFKRISEWIRDQKGKKAKITKQVSSQVQCLPKRS